MDERRWYADVCKHDFAEVGGVVWIDEDVEPLDEGFVHGVLIIVRFIIDGKDIFYVGMRGRFGDRCIEWAFTWVGTSYRVRCA